MLFSLRNFISYSNLYLYKNVCIGGQLLLNQDEILKKMEEWPKHYNPKEIEEKWQKIWLSEEYWRDVFRFRDEDDKAPRFVIDTPPPFTSGELHMGHAYWVTIADTIGRFKRLEGYNVLLPQGWDTQGLPTELKVQYKLGIPKDNRQLFLQKCIEWTEEMIKKMKEAMIRLGYRPEWERFEYKTYEPKYRKIIQKSLIDMYKMNLIEMREGPVIWCPKCETALAQSEVGYLEKEGILAYIKFPLKEGGEIVIATTRPELLAATQAIAVNPMDERYKNLVGKIALVPIFNIEVKIISDADVEKEFGTGAVMISTYGDPQDIKWQLKYNLPIKVIVDEKGRIINTNGILDGLKIEQARNKMIELLKTKGYLVKVEKIKHNVLSHVERSDCLSPVEFLVKKQIYIKVLDKKQKLLEEYKKMKFKPARMSYYLEDWIKSIEWDWNITRQRIYGTPLPFWYCENGHLVPAKEEDLPIDPIKTSPPLEKCPLCGSELKPVTDVADVWIDSSVTVLYLTKFYEDKNVFNRTFPASLRLQGTDIIRTWLFYTFFRTLMLANNVPFTTVLVNGQVLGPDGTRMSKSKGNVVSPLDRVNDFGADAIRMALLDASIGDDFPFKWDIVKGKKMLLQKLWNASRLVYPFIAKQRLDKPKSLHIVDKWILQEHKKFVTKAINAYENYDFYLVLQELYNYFWEIVADEYLEMIKHRLFDDDNSAKYTIQRIIRDIIILLHPIAPHITEEIYSRLFGHKKSVLLEELPKVDDIEENKRIDELGEVIKKTNSLIRSEKIKNRLSMNTPVSVKLYASKQVIELINEVKDDVMKTLKVTNLELIESNEEKVEIKTANQSMGV
ncbi:valine--tRNA ligase [Saccharolobus solfataricus]|uniref:Valine--tRNA ligase n=2 Tax=Saccharolobus solfataricus TaxID=2287 RepID=SYV_SACS2|nr:valine--tRNA ligase [Saccharolobus solfataricus]Q97ZK9.1 RecName: Full=Valine--tRNA ligase; AltName: Full=Valyl-tRNA synthetase; Short=ValRS [Saccharolobus solfataricus P2]AAK41179.1 Valyl-tRNA synthetase (valS) [Saccharolobus solfataricus P2]AKA74133.1 valine--tRNA ligase [Saccharolobus solfataricus]AKA76831.1 valine--tRNA ligase [Saccharolobus solfataricus]AKA79524.1 valine--tRNA ligase [Saccharolobus solfataricus]AZF68612.1 valine--tRNA ligase [Saccharolobus solfataricus]